MEASNILFLLLEHVKGVIKTTSTGVATDRQKSDDYRNNDGMHVPLFNYREFQCAQLSQMVSMKENNHWLQGSSNKVTTQDTALLSKCHAIKLNHIFIYLRRKKKHFKQKDQISPTDLASFSHNLHMNIKMSGYENSCQVKLSSIPMQFHIHL